MKHIQVLVVDDEDDYRDTLVKRMQRRNYTVRGARDGQEALQMMDETPADLVLLDMRMPRMNGMQTLLQLRERHPAAKVILVTGHACAETARNGLLHGAYDYMLKPVTLDQIMARIKDCVASEPHASTTPL